MNQTRLHFFLAIFICLGCLLSVAFSVSSQVPEVKVVVNPSVESKEMSVEQIRRIFSMRQTNWPNDQSITVYVLANQHQTHQVFSTKVLGMFPYQLERIWNKLVYSGLGEEPIKLQSEQEMLERVSEVPGAIGYVIQQVESHNVNVIKVLEN
ncbi:substrate-binding domain-containing protein [uncultured Paraglaciecola sp.]|uniref:substrate-binding domain-containing protein n=1 Tax=uncultured Paraglaciecola sp. TaxID=1765024 RepID=UPI0030DA550A